MVTKKNKNAMTSKHNLEFTNLILYSSICVLSLSSYSGKTQAAVEQLFTLNPVSLYCTDTRDIGAATDNPPDSSALVPILLEEFDKKKVDKKVWRKLQESTGGGNQSIQAYTNEKENIKVENGVLKLIQRKEFYVQPRGGDNSNFGDPSQLTVRPYTSGALDSKTQFNVDYCQPGRIDIAYRVPNRADGMWPAVWTLFTDATFHGGFSAGGEIDIGETFFGISFRPVLDATVMNIIFGGEFPFGSNFGPGWGFFGLGLNWAYQDINSTVLGFDATQEHVYSVVWDSKGFSTLVDGVVQNYVSATDAAIINPFLPPPIGGNGQPYAVSNPIAHGTFPYQMTFNFTNGNPSDMASIFSDFFPLIGPLNSVQTNGDFDFITSGTTPPLLTGLPAFAPLLVPDLAPLVNVNTGFHGTYTENRNADLQRAPDIVRRPHPAPFDHNSFHMRLTYALGGAQFFTADGNGGFKPKTELFGFLSNCIDPILNGEVSTCAAYDPAMITKPFKQGFRGVVSAQRLSEATGIPAADWESFLASTDFEFPEISEERVMEVDYVRYYIPEGDTTICKNPHREDGGQTVMVDATKVKKRLKKGDYLGPCRPDKVILLESSSACDKKINTIKKKIMWLKQECQGYYCKHKIKKLRKELHKTKQQCNKEDDSSSSSSSY